MTALRRLMSVTLCLLSSAAFVSRAHAGPAITVSIDSPGDGSVLTGIVEVRASAHSAAGVKRIEVSIDGFGVASKQPSGYQQDASVVYSWDSNEDFDSSSIIANGPHTITVRAVATGGPDDSATVDVETNNPPVAPSGLSAAADGGTVALEWPANPEPDITGYVVERDSGSGFVTVGRVASSGFGETLVAGAYAYRVSALRSSPVSDDGIASSPSTPVSVNVSSDLSRESGSVTKLTSKHPLGGADARPLAGAARSNLAALLSGRTLPDSGALPAIPSPDGVTWGTYEAALPYDQHDAAAPPGLRSRALTSSSTLSVVPPDGLRWVAAGLLLLVCAGLSQLLAAYDVPAPRIVVRGRRALAHWFTRDVRT